MGPAVDGDGGGDGGAQELSDKNGGTGDEDSDGAFCPKPSSYL